MSVVKFVKTGWCFGSGDGVGICDEFLLDADRNEGVDDERLLLKSIRMPDTTTDATAANTNATQRSASQFGRKFMLLVLVLLALSFTFNNVCLADAKDKDKDQDQFSDVLVTLSRFSDDSVNGTISGAVLANVTALIKGENNDTVEGLMNGTITAVVTGSYNSTANETVISLVTGDFTGTLNGTVKGTEDVNVTVVVTGIVNGTLIGSSNDTIMIGKLVLKLNGTVNGTSVKPTPTTTTTSTTASGSSSDGGKAGGSESGGGKAGGSESGGGKAGGSESGGGKAGGSETGKTVDNKGLKLDPSSMTGNGFVRTISFVRLGLQDEDPTLANVTGTITVEFNSTINGTLAFIPDATKEPSGKIEESDDNPYPTSAGYISLTTIVYTLGGACVLFIGYLFFRRMRVAKTTTKTNRSRNGDYEMLNQMRD
ncbi:hypothetical protein PPL_03448 [Heterostelium album PN500]|uniref:Uncharacterized protein n=1 Tax=Heterostelium pallidum (strain ATCC 26659 / Pp 5 / PN500) TaxID=670386 RepID=D3B4X2_HETP5|nr:hypothetical protein PPL_03448 [Heterostelium album PN500]EFA84370.1 hypothetical protein PPL_03448 [Heterostelium album PN500]|eukprot:XP_020436485.1 hypothetical protein PPL_03448 [Heterostelium album PN500]